MPSIGLGFISFLLGISTLIYSQSSELDAALQEIKTDHEIVGMSVSIIRGDEISFSKGYGLRDIDRSLPVDDSTLYRIASISKFVVTAALMKLYDQGLFNIEDDVSDYIGFTLRNPVYPDDIITFRKLLSHTSSLRDGSGYSAFLSATYNNDPPPILESLLTPDGTYFTSDMFSSKESPSSNYFTYANINFGVVGTLVERLSNIRFDIFCRQEIFEPLGMTSSFNVQDLPNINNVAVLYRKTGQNWIPQADNYLGIMPEPRDLSAYIIGTNGVIFGPQGGLRTSANDLSKFMNMIMNEGEYNAARILEDTTVALILTPTWIYDGSNGDNYYGIFNTYGFGSHRTTDLLPTETLYGHPGEAYGLISDLYFSKIKDYGIVFITNGGSWNNGDYSGWYDIEEKIYQASLKYIDSITVDVESNVLPEKGYKLYQNYPNPFNPETVINYEIQNYGAVQLKVYDILGNEVVTLVNEVKQPGNYEITFNADNLSGGVYFYRLLSENYSETKSMILLK